MGLMSDIGRVLAVSSAWTGTFMRGPELQESILNSDCMLIASSIWGGRHAE